MQHDLSAFPDAGPRPTTSTGSSASPGPGRRGAVALMTGSGLSNQLGASLAALAFPALGPAGVVSVRQWVAALVLGGVGRPRLRHFTAAQWRVVLGLALVFAVMNLSLYTAIERIGLGLAVTLEFLGPLTVALAGSRRRLDLVCAAVAAGAVALLMRPTPSTDYVGIGLALLAALCWGSYIRLNQAAGSLLPGVEGSAAAAAVSGTLYLPVGAWALWRHPPTVPALACALAAGVLSSAVPFLADLLALRRTPAHLFGVFMSINPVFAALIGLAVLGQRLDVLAWLAIAMIAGANTAALATAPRAHRPRSDRTLSEGAPPHHTPPHHSPRDHSPSDRSAKDRGKVLDHGGEGMPSPEQERSP